MTENLNIAQRLLDSLPEKAVRILRSNYDEIDRIDNAYVEGQEMFVNVNRGIVGSATIEDVYSY